MKKAKKPSEPFKMKFFLQGTKVERQLANIGEGLTVTLTGSQAELKMRLPGEHLENEFYTRMSDKSDIGFDAHWYRHPGKAYKVTVEEIPPGSRVWEEMEKP